MFLFSSGSLLLLSLATLLVAPQLAEALGNRKAKSTTPAPSQQELPLSPSQSTPKHSSTNQPASNPDHVAGQLLVSLKPETKASKRREIFAKLGIKEKTKVGSTELYLVEVPSASSLDSIIETLQNFPEVRFAEKNMTVKTYKPLDPKNPIQ